jgi:hypothetical protein
MPVVTIVKATGTSAASNRNLATLLGSQAPLSGWVTGLILQSPDTNLSASGGIKVGSSVMTSTDYDAVVSPGDSYNDESSVTSPIMLNTRYVRTDEAADQSLIIRFQPT